MKKNAVVLILFFVITSSLFALTFESGLSAKSDILEDGTSYLWDCSVDLYDKYRIFVLAGSNKAYSLDFEYDNGKFFSPFLKLHSNYVFQEGGFGSLCCGLSLALDTKSIGVALVVGATGGLNYSEYTNLRTVTLFPLYNLDLTLNAYKTHFSLSLGNRLPFENDIKSPLSLTFKGEYEVTAKSRVGIMGAISMAEILMDPYYVVYSRFLRISYSYEV